MLSVQKLQVEQCTVLHGVCILRELAGRLGLSWGSVVGAWCAWRTMDLVCGEWMPIKSVRAWRGVLVYVSRVARSACCSACELCVCRPCAARTVSARDITRDKQTSAFLAANPPCRYAWGF